MSRLLHTRAYVCVRMPMHVIVCYCTQCFDMILAQDQVQALQAVLITTQRLSRMYSA